MGTSEHALADQPLRHVLESFAARTPAPGGGCAAALSGALGAGLVEMAARFTGGREQAAGEAAALRGELLAEAERELHAYEPVLEALALDAGDPAREAALGEALSAAAESPMAIARAALEAAQLGAEIAHTGNRHLVGDAITGALLAEAACCAAARLAQINLARVPSDPRLDEAVALTRQAAAAREQALGGMDGT
jgi:methenyltetrahydrofolate cyclohydrolase